jgi:hypothetical protein
LDLSYFLIWPQATYSLICSDLSWMSYDFLQSFFVDLKNGFLICLDMSWICLVFQYGRRLGIYWSVAICLTCLTIFHKVDDEKNRGIDIEIYKQREFC